MDKSDRELISPQLSQEYDQLLLNLIDAEEYNLSAVLSVAITLRRICPDYLVTLVAFAYELMRLCGLQIQVIQASMKLKNALHSEPKSSINVIDLDSENN